MPTHQNQNFQDAVILTRSVENVFRKLIRFLIGRISLVKLQEIIRKIYIEEAEIKLRNERPNKDVSLTRLALLTGLDTRVLTKVRNSDQYRKPFHQESRFIKAMTPESCVLDVWSSGAEYLDSSSGRPKQLKIQGQDLSFEQLVKEAVSTRGVTVQSILTNLLNNEAVRFNESTQTIELLEKIQAPYKAGNHWGALEAGILHVCSLLESVFHNFEAVRDGKAPYYQRGSWTNRLNRAKSLDFQIKMGEFLEFSDDEARRIIENFEEEIEDEEQITAGISMFYFEERWESS